MELIEKTVRLPPTSKAEAIAAYEQMTCAFTLYGLSPEAQNATWRSAKQFISYLLLTHGEVLDDCEADEALTEKRNLSTTRAR